MRKGMLYRIYPTKEQEPLLEKHFGCCRFIYNHFLDIRRTLQAEYHCNIPKSFLDAQLPILKEEYPWLKEVNSQSLQQANKNLDNAYGRYYQGLADYPTEKKKKKNNSFQVTQRYKINLTTSKIYLPNIGWVKVKMHRDLFSSEHNLVKTKSGNEIILNHADNSDFLRTVTVSKTPTGKYNISILIEDGLEYPDLKPFTQADVIGVDRGIKVFSACSDGRIIENPRFLKSSEERLIILQKSVSRKNKGSKNRRKAIVKLSKLHEKVANQRRDFQDKESLRLVRENQAIAFEDLNTKGMMKNHKLAKAIGDVGWYSFEVKVTYKAKRVGGTILKIGRFEPSSKNCHVCGYHNSELTLKNREWQCPECNTMHDRDINAAINIKKFAISAYQIPVGTTGNAYRLGKNDTTTKNEVGSLTALA
jgi:putative transposase